MKNLIRIFFISLVLSIVIIFTPYFSNATNIQVNDQTSLDSAIENADDGDVIELTDNISLTHPISITGKNITINGNAHTISKANENWQPDGQNGSLITAGGAGTKLTLTNISLKNAQKYGVQSYNGAHVVLNNVSISDNAYGGVLVNAGTVEVVNLNLGRNGQSNNNGIEIGKGSTTGNNVPTLVMNGTITSTEGENVVYIAKNDNLSEFAVKNEENTVDKILVSGNKVVITDANNNILYTSNTYEGLTFSGDTYVETPPEPTPAPAEMDTTPKTGTIVVLPIAILVALISAIALIDLTINFNNYSKIFKGNN